MPQTDFDIELDVELPLEVEADEPPAKSASSSNGLVIGIIVAVVVIGLGVGIFFWFRSQPAKVGWTNAADAYAVSLIDKTEYALPQVDTARLSADQMHFTKEFFTAAAALKAKYSLANVNRLYTAAEHVTAKPNIRINCPNFSCEGLEDELKDRQIMLSTSTKPILLDCCRNQVVSTKSSKNVFSADSFAMCLKRDKDEKSYKKWDSILKAIDFASVGPNDKCESIQN